VKLWTLAESEAIIGRVTDLSSKFPEAKEGVIYFMVVGVPIPINPTKPDAGHHYRIANYLTVAPTLANLLVTSIQSAAPQIIPALFSQLALLVAQPAVDRLELVKAIEESKVMEEIVINMKEEDDSGQAN
jgi:hypothetical protein